MGNRATDLLRTMQQRHAERAQWAALDLFLAAGPALALPAILGWAGVLLGILCLAVFALRTLAVLQRIVGQAVGQTAALYAVTGRVIEFRVPAWHVVGAE